MTEEVGVENGSDWKKFLRKHWNIVAIFAVAGIFALAGAVYVYLWFVGEAQSTGMVPSTLGLWTMGNMVTFILHLIFWGTSLHRHSSNYRSSSRLAMVEKTT